MNPYIEQKILNADPIELIRILYQHGILSVREAREHLRTGRIIERAKAINLAWGVIAELNAALRPEEAPEFANRLRDLYTYMQRRLVEANFEQRDEPLAEVLGLMTTLSEAWSAAQTPAPVESPLSASGSGWHASMAGAAAGAISSGMEICG